VKNNSRKEQLRSMGTRYNLKSNGDWKYFRLRLKPHIFNWIYKLAIEQDVSINRMINELFETQMKFMGYVADDGEVMTDPQEVARQLTHDTITDSMNNYLSMLEERKNKEV
tara:strand:- start:8738 stop:9070 length:333 start_codon:yes stop_codon:yes gene_type:complete